MTLGKNPTDVADIRRQLREARAAIDAAELALAALPIGAGGASMWPEQWGTVAEAQRIRQCTHETMVYHIQKHGLGVKVDRRWRVELNRVRAWDQGRPFPPLDAFRGSSEVSRGSDSPAASGE